MLIAWLAHQGSVALPLLSTLRIDSQALVWTVFMAVFTAMIFGLLPGLRMASGNLQEALKDSGAGAGLGRKHERVRAALVVSEIALACVLLVSAGLLLRSFIKVLDVDLGFQPDRAASIQVSYDESAPSADARIAKRSAIFQQILARVSALPGVEAAGIADFLPARTQPRMGYSGAARKNLCSGRTAGSPGIRDYAGIHPRHGHSTCTGETSPGPMDRTARELS